VPAQPLKKSDTGSLKKSDAAGSGTLKALDPTPPPGKPTTNRTSVRATPPPSSSDPFAKPKDDRVERAGVETVDDEPQAARWESVHDIDSEPLPAAVATFGDYEILTEIARGGMGIVYKARRKGSPKLLALKVLISGVDATEEQVRRFEREGEAARRFRHANIVRVYDAGRHEGYHYIAMEFVEGKSLEDLLQAGPLDAKRAAEIVRDMARAVDHMHQAGVIHRDLKPGNILLDKDGKPKLIDFGLAKTIDRSSKLTRSGAAVGTPYYMPPEQVRGEGVTAQSDVYALGAILYELVVGEVPFSAENPIELYHKIASSELVLPSKLIEGLPADLETIVAHSMEKQPKDRYASAAALADDLELFVNGQAVQAKRAGAVKVAARKARKHVLIFVAFGVAVVGTLAVVLGWQKFSEKPGGDSRATVYYEEGMQELEKGNAEVARSLLENAHRKNPEDVPTMMALARAYSKTGETDRALSLVERASEKGLADPKELEAKDLDPIRKAPKFAACVDKVRARAGAPR
jgi:serine/threonine protein kinase